MQNNKIEYKEYSELLHHINLTSYDRMIEIHKSLVKKSCDDSYIKIDDCGVDILKSFLTYDRYNTYDFYKCHGNAFVQSEYLSNYFKESLKEFFLDERISERVVNALESEKTFNEMDARDIKAINTYVNAYKNNKHGDNVSEIFLNYIMKLDGEGPKTFVKEYIDKRIIIDDILSTSHMSSRASYYSGRGVTCSDLNSDILINIFKKLYRLDKKYAIEFIKMISKMETLEATPFIENLYEFANNGFKIEGLKIKNDNVSLDGVYDNARDLVLLSSLCSFNKSKDRGHDISISNDIKERFIWMVSPMVEKVCPNFDRKKWIERNENIYHNYMKKKRLSL